MKFPAWFFVGSWMMYRKLFLFFLLLFPALLSAQQSAKVSGTLPSNVQEVKLLVDPFYLGHKPKTYTETGKAKFNFDIQLDRNRFVVLRAGDKELSLYLEPGDELVVDWSGKQPSFSGKGAENNLLFQDFVNTFGNGLPDTTKIMESLVDIYEMEAFQQRKKQDAFLKKELKAGKHSEKFISLMNELPGFRYRAALLNWTSIQSLKTGKGCMKRLPAVMEEEMVPGIFESEDRMLLGDYRAYLWLYMRYLNAGANGFLPYADGNASYIHLYETAQKEMRPAILSWFLGDLLYHECSLMNSATARRLHNELVAIDRTFHYSGAAFEKCGTWMNQKEEKKEDKEDAIAKSRSGMKFRDMAGKEFFMGSLKGKVVYIDIWASWCGPCRAQAPYAKALKEKLSPEQAKQIVFLYISIDDNETNWKKAVEQLGLHGIQVISPGGWGSEICQQFNVTSIPRYLLMNKKGEIVDYNAKRPGDPMLFDDLLNLLK